MFCRDLREFEFFFLWCRALVFYVVRVSGESGFQQPGPSNFWHGDESLLCGLGCEDGLGFRV